MIEFQSVVTDPLGLHIRPAGLLVKLASQFSCSVTLRYGEKSADAKRIFSIMSLGISPGGVVTVAVDGEDETEASRILCDFFTQNL